MSLIKNATRYREQRLEAFADHIIARRAEDFEQRAVYVEDSSVTSERNESAWRPIEQRFHSCYLADWTGSARYDFIASMVSSGCLMCGQWPVADKTCSVLLGKF